MSLDAHDLVLSYGGIPVIDGLSLRIPRGQITALVGANASGKSTLLRALGRLMRPRGGSVLLDGEAIASLDTRAVARRLAILPQGPVAPEALTVRQLVAQGRHAHQRFLRRWSADDEATLREALEATGISDLAGRPVDELSGGQRQRAWIAMALAQQTDVLLLDEPTTYLDLAHQVSILELVAQLNTRDQRTIVMVLHDLNQAARYADEIVALRDGAIVAAGPPAQMITEELVRNVSLLLESYAWQLALPLAGALIAESRVRTPGSARVLRRSAPPDGFLDFRITTLGHSRFGASPWSGPPG